MRDLQRRSALDRLRSAFFPLLALAVTFDLLIRAEKATYSPTDKNLIFTLLLLSSASLLVSGISLSRNFYDFRAAWPFALSVTFLFLAWGWQIYFYRTRFPRGIFEDRYAYRLAEPSINFLFEEGPSNIITFALFVLLISGVVAGWRNGARGSIVLLFGWMVAAWVVYQMGWKSMIAYGVPRFFK